MKSLLAQIKTYIAAAMTTALGDDAGGVAPQVQPAGDPKFGDYQCNAAMGLAKKLGRKPRDIAASIVEAMPEAAIAILEPPEIAGPGFINLRLKDTFIQATLESIPAAPTDEVDQSRDRQGAGQPTLDQSRASKPAVGARPAEDRLGIEPVSGPDKQTVVVDYSSPNVAKQMHVGHLRSTVIGDTIARVLEFEGHDVIRQNHIGDWGTQFGIILEELRDRGYLEKIRTSTESYSLPRARLLPRDPGTLEEVYKAGNARMGDAAFAARAREAVGRLQNGAENERQAWELIAHSSMAGVVGLYGRLGVKLTDGDTCGESFYNPLLVGVVEELRAVLQSRDREGAVGAQERGLAAMGREPLPDGRGPERGDHSDSLHAVCQEDQGALCIFLANSDGTPAFKGPKGTALPMIIQKSDGAYLYATTDLAAIAYRINRMPTGTGRHRIHFRGETLARALVGLGVPDSRLMHPPQRASRAGLGADRIIYVVGSPQKLHFQMLFATVRALGWTRPGDGKREVQLQHVSFGSVLGEDRKMLRTRTGENVKLADLLDEAVRRAEELVRKTEADEEKRRGFSEGEIKAIAETIGIASVKYADLSQNRNSDYVFSWDKMLALQGNTAPYLLYAYARIRSIYRKGTSDKPFDIDADHAAIHLGHAAERNLALAILRLPEVLDGVADHLMPNFLCEYLYDLAGRFMVFYESCPVLKAPDERTYATRLRLCDLTGRALKLGLDLLGISTLERM